MLRGFYQYFGLHHCKPKLEMYGSKYCAMGPHPTATESAAPPLLVLSAETAWFELPYAVAALHATV